MSLKFYHLLKSIEAVSKPSFRWFEHFAQEGFEMASNQYRITPNRIWRD